MSKTVALDIGHGSNTFPPSKGVYVGGKGYAEHDFNSKLVVAIDKLLKQSGVNTLIYQKPNSADIGLTKRTNYYNSKKVDLVYSIHANYNSNSKVNGRCVFYWHTSKQGKKMADIIVEEIKKAGYSTHGNGLHASERGSWTNLHICRETTMPAVLVENGFMSGDKDFDLVFGSKQADYIKDMAEVHAKSICRYFGVSYKGKATASKPTPSKPKAPAKKPAKKASTTEAPSMASTYVGSRVESKVNGLRFYAKRSWEDKDVVGRVNKGIGFPTIVSRHKVGNGYQYKVKNSRGATYYITASSKYVNVVGSTSKKKTTSTKRPSLKVGSKVSIKQSARFYSTGERIPNSIKGRTYTIMQVGKGKVLLREIMSWVKSSDVQ